MVEDFCAERVEPAPELSVNKQTATLALKKSERKGAVFGLLIRVVPPDKHLVPFWGSGAYFDLESPGDREMYSRIQLTKIISQNQAQKDSEST